MDPCCHIDTCFWYPNKNVFFGILKASSFSNGRLLREGPGVRLRIMNHESFITMMNQFYSDGNSLGCMCHLHHCFSISKASLVQYRCFWKRSLKLAFGIQIHKKKRRFWNTKSKSIFFQYDTFWREVSGGQTNSQLSIVCHQYCPVLFSLLLLPFVSFISFLRFS